MAYNPYLPGLEPNNTMNNPVWNPDTQQFEYGFGNSAKAITARSTGLGHI